MNKKCVIFDLDDTLYKEIDFLKSGFRSIIERLPLLNKEAIYENMLRKYQNGDDAFDYILQLCPDLNKNMLLCWYREHKPNIHMTKTTIDCLAFLRKKGVVLGLITDGRSLTQRNKIQALGLNRYMCNRDIVISEEIGSEKPSRINFNHIANIHQDCNLFYVGDNPKKDFVTPNELGWVTIGLRDNGQNIHIQKLEIGNFEPQIWINDISEIKVYV